MISTPQLPEKVSLTGNPVLVDLKSDQHQGSAGQYAQLRLSIDLKDDFIGRVLNIHFLNQIIQLWTAQQPDNSGNQIPVANGSETLYEWVVRIAQCMRMNYLLARYYEVTSYGKNIYIKARDYGPNYNISLHSHTLNQVTAYQTQGTLPVLRNRFRIVVETHVMENGNYQLVNEDAWPLDDQGKVLIDVRSCLSPFVYGSFTFPETGPCLVKRPEHTRKFKLRMHEQWVEGYSFVHARVKEVTDLIAMTGGISSMYELRLKEKGSRWFYNHGITKQFLTWQPKEKSVALDQVEKLYFLVGLATAVNMKITYSYTGTTSGSGSITKVLTNVSQFSVVECIVTPARLGITLPAGCSLAGFTVVLLDQNGKVISEERTYSIDANYYQNPATFLFRNSYGCFDTIRCTGRQSLESKFERETVTNSEELYKYSRRPQKVINTNAEETGGVANTGWLLQEQTDWLRDLFLSKEVYMIKNGSLYPVVITTDSIDIRTDDNYLYNFAIQYQYGFTDEHYSNETCNVFPVLAQPAVIDGRVRPPSVVTPQQILYSR
jgi:hypothetical protein